MPRSFGASGGGSTWRTAANMWVAQGGAWRPVKTVWAAQGGVWWPVYPPGFVSFNVAATTGEIGYTSSTVSWDIPTSVAATVNIQRKAPGGSWVNVLTDQGTPGSVTLNPLAPAQSAAGTWYYRAVYIPVANPGSPIYSAEDSVLLSLPSITFSVTQTSGEVGYTNGSMSWTTTSGFDGTVKLQRKFGAGGTWTDFATGLAKSSSGSYLLAPIGSSAGTWYYRAVFTPTSVPGWEITSAEDSVLLTTPTVSLAVSATSGEVHYTSSSMSWSTSGSLTGTVKLQRKQGAGGAWTDFATGLAKSSSGSYQLVPAGSARNGTWYYRAVFTPTGSSGWDFISPEDSVSIAYRNQGTMPTGAYPWVSQGNTHGNPQDEFNPYRSEMKMDATAYIAMDWGTISPSEVASYQYTLNGFRGHYLWNNGSGGDSWYSWSYAQDADSSSVTFTCTRVQFDLADTFDEYPGVVWGLMDSSSRTWAQIIPIGWRHADSYASIPTGPTWGHGRNDIGTVSCVLTITFVDGQVRTTTVPRYPQASPTTYMSVS